VTVCTQLWHCALAVAAMAKIAGDFMAEMKITNHHVPLNELESLSQSLCQHLSQCTSHHRQHLAQLLTPSTVGRKEQFTSRHMDTEQDTEQESQLTPAMVVMAAVTRRLCMVVVTAPWEATQVTE